MTAKTSTSGLVERLVDYLTEPRPELMKLDPPGEASDSTVIADPNNPDAEDKNHEQKTNEAPQTSGDACQRTSAPV